MTYDGNGKIQYFKQFMEREVKFLNEVRKSLALDPSNELVKKILAIKAVVEDNVENAKDMTFEFVKGFFMENSITMQKNVKEKLEETIDRVLKAPQVRKEMLERGIEPSGGTAEDFAELIKVDQQKWSKLIQEKNIKID
jgi:hypothetical protein